MEFSSMTFEEVEAAVRAGAVVLWPMGATEAHGPHLPLDTDVIIAEAAARTSASRIEADHGLRALVLPSLAYAVTDYAKPFSGTISIRREVAQAFVGEVISQVSRQGFRALLLVNGHLEPKHRSGLRAEVRSAAGGCPVGIVDPADRRFAGEFGEEFLSGSCHAGRYETSILLAARPEAVRLELAKGLPSVHVDLLQEGDFQTLGATRAYCGDPAAASAEEGRAILAKFAQIASTVLGELLGR